MKKYSVFGMYADTWQRSGFDVEATDADHAEVLARQACEVVAPGTEFLVAAVIEGWHEPVDIKEYAND